MNLVEFIRKCESENKMYKFYKLKAWLKLRSEILKESHNECYDCKVLGKLTIGTTNDPLEVHHINFVRVRPDLALSKFYIDENNLLQPNLVALCHSCHDKRHSRFGNSSTGYTNQEKW